MVGSCCNKTTCVGPTPVVLLNTPRYAQQVLVEHNDHFEKSPLLHTYLRPLLGDGLLTIDQAEHRPQRKVIAPAMQHHRVTTYADVIASFSAQLRATWADDSVIDIHHEMTRLTLWIVGQTLFNADVRDDTTSLRRTMDAIAHVADELATTLLHLPIAWPTPRNLRFRRAIRQIHTVVDRVIAEHRQAAVDPGDLLSMLLHAQDADDGRVLTDAQVRDEVLTFFIAGHATTATALTWCWYLLANHPETYSRLCTEVDQVLDGRLPTAADLPNLPYTLQVFKETLRLYPPAYAILRQTVQPLELDGYHLPRGMRVVISPYTLHRRPDTFPDLERFDPDRWTPEREAKLPRFAYLPFSTGPRNCVGSQFALMEGQMVLATIAQQVRFSVAPNQRIRPELLTVENPQAGIHLVVHRRADRYLP